MKFFISPSEESGSITEVNLFATKLKIDWPMVIINNISDPDRDFALEWDIIIYNKYISGKLSRKLDFVVFQFSNIELGAEFSLWVYRNLAKKRDIILYDDDYSNTLPLSSSTTVGDIINSF